jgi:hypothetical protein
VKTLCAIVSNGAFFFGVDALYLALLAFVFMFRVRRRRTQKICAAAFVVTMILAPVLFYSDRFGQCRIVWVASHHFGDQPAHFECEYGKSTLYGVPRREALAALQRCDADHWSYEERTGQDTRFRCVTPGVEIWADLGEVSTLDEWNVCFAACRPGKCPPTSVMLPELDK